MLKVANSVKPIEHRAADAVKDLLAQVPVIEIEAIEIEAHRQDRSIDFVARVRSGGRHHVLICEVKASGQPRHVHAALLQLRDYIARAHEDAIPVVIAPYLSPESQALCREYGACFLDLAGNARIVFDGVFIERQVDSKPAAERRELRSLFRPKAARLLRALLREPGRSWRVTELAAAADVSIGHVSNVRSALIERSWAQATASGLQLAKPGSLLDAWRNSYDGTPGQRLGFYTTLHGGAFDKAARDVLADRSPHGRAILGSFSAARWLAPYGRTGMEILYADAAGVENLKQALELSSAAKGENVTVIVPADDGVFLDSVEPAAGIVCTSPVQTYLDLAAAGERGREAADHLREARLTWPA